MIKKAFTLLISVFFLSVPAFANHGVDAMGDGIILIFGFAFIVVVLAVVSIVVSYRAYKQNKTYLKVIGIVLSIPIAIAGIVVSRYLFNIIPLIALVIVFVNMLLILNAKSPVEIKETKPFDQN